MLITLLSTLQKINNDDKPKRFIYNNNNNNNIDEIREENYRKLSIIIRDWFDKSKGGIYHNSNSKNHSK